MSKRARASANTIESLSVITSPMAQSLKKPHNPYFGAAIISWTLAFGLSNAESYGPVFPFLGGGAAFIGIVTLIMGIATQRRINRIKRQAP